MKTCLKTKNFFLLVTFQQERKALMKIINKQVHYQKPDVYGTKITGEMYNLHSPYDISRGKAAEMRSKIFVDSPNVPNRLPKYFFLFCIVMTIWAGASDKIKRRHRQYLQEQDRLLYKQIAPFVQAMEDLRFTAKEQRLYMINKAIADQYSPYLFEHLRKRFNQEDIYVWDLIALYRNYGAGSFQNFNSGLDPTSKRALRTYWDKGLFDNREVGFTN